MYSKTLNPEIVPLKLFEAPNIAPEEIRTILQRLPILEFPELFHVGKFKDGIQKYESHEGPLLSTSLHPQEWSEIARLTGDTYKITKKNKDPFKLIDVIQVKTLGKNLINWGVEKELVILDTLSWWIVPCDSNEDGNTRYCWSQTPEECRDYEIEEDPIQKPVYLPSEILQKFWNQRQINSKSKITPWNTYENLLGFLVCIDRQNNPIDGLYWEENFQPELLSAPRAGLIPTNQLKIQKYYD